MAAAENPAQRRLARMLASRRLPHALLFAGPAGSGKRTAARRLAMRLSCAHPRGAEPCGACEPCHKIEAGLHPDVLVLRPEGRGEQIKIEKIRELSARLAYPPHEGEARVVVLEDAHELNENAANAFLKTLEEPPPRTHFLLLTAAPEQLPQTILSRCQRVQFVAAPSARHDAASPEELERRRGHARALAAAARSRSFKAAVDAAAALAAQKDDVGPTLDLLGLWYRDAAALAAGVPVTALAHPEEVDALREEPGSPVELSRCAAAVLAAHKAILDYASAPLALERMILAASHRERA
jgi:DNA polymerase-3 subunit delta'